MTIFLAKRVSAMSCGCHTLQGLVHADCGGIWRTTAKCGFSPRYRQSQMALAARHADHGRVPAITTVELPLKTTIPTPTYSTPPRLLPPHSKIVVPGVSRFLFARITTHTHARARTLSRQRLRYVPCRNNFRLSY